ncbi:MAG: EamA family transporter [Planctomycetes bacterium]|nr:EamA family transporter [Planctomycetota bacterium]
MSSKARARLALVAAAALFSTGGAAIKGTSFRGFELAGLRSAVAVLAFLVFLPAARARPSPRIMLVALAYAATLICFVLANKLTTSANTIFLQSTAPLYVLLLAPLLLRERIRPRDLVILVAIAGGIWCLFLDELAPQASASDPALGNKLALISGFTWALTMIGLRWLARGGSDSAALGAAVWGNVLAACVCLGGAALRHELTLSEAGAQSWLLVGFLGVFQIGLAYALVTSAVRHLEAFEVSLLLLCEPVLNPLWSFLFQGERPGFHVLLGGALILGAALARSFHEARLRSL